MTTYVQITSGRGPEECCFVVRKITKIFLDEMTAAGVNCSIVDKEQSDSTNDGNLKSVTIFIEAPEKVEQLLKTWEGTVQWIGQSTYRKFHKRKNWFIGLSIHKFDDYEFNPNDVEITAYCKAAGNGGQNVNKTSTAIRLVHKPTGLVILSASERSQLHNKKVALLKLHKALEEIKVKANQQSESIKWMDHNTLERGNPVRTYNEKFVRIN